MTDAEIEKALTAFDSGPCPKRDRALFLLGVRTGFRISELLSLTIADVFQNGNYVDKIWIARKNVKNKQEGQAVALHSQAKAALKDWVQELKDREGVTTGPLFRGQGRDKPISRVQAYMILKKAFAAAGITGKLGTHCMRKTFAKRIWEKSGKDLIQTQKALRHRRITSTTSYLSCDEDGVDDLVLKD